MGKTQLFCIPYAGGSANFYFKFKKFLNNDIEILPIELSGHSTRMDEKCFDTMENVVQDLAKQIVKKSTGVSYALFGYSMGSTICYELAYELSKKIGQPIHIFYAAQIPPYSLRNEEQRKLKLRDLSDEVLLQYIRRFHMIPDELLQDDDIYEMIMSVLRADFHTLLSYHGARKVGKMKCDISGIYSEDEKGDMKAWADSTEGNFTEYQFEGGHFFVNQYLQELVEIINNTLQKYI